MLRKEMIIIDNKIVTKDILYCEYDIRNNTYVVRYVNGNKYYI